MITSNRNFLDIVILSIIFCNLFFGNAFQNFGIKGLPINEIFLFFFLIFINENKNLFNVFKYIDFKSFSFILFISIIYIFIFFSKNGVCAIRDGFFIIDILYIFVGYYFFNNTTYFLKLKQFFFFIAKVSLIYILFVIFSEYLVNFSPIIETYSGNRHSLFFNFFTTKFIFLWSAIIFYTLKIYNNFFYSLISIILLSASIIFFQSRVIYISLLFCFIFLNKIKIINFNHLLIFIFLFILINISGIQFYGRLQTFDIKFFYEHVLTLFSPFFDFESSNIKIEGQIGSANDRLNWWKSIIANSQTDIKTFLIGQGFGFPLINFYAGPLDIPAREPHNSYITFIGRIGYLGTVIWFLFHYKILKLAKNTLKFKNINKDQLNIITIIICYLIIILVSSLGDSIFQFPCLTIPFYFFIGVLIKISIFFKK